MSTKSLAPVHPSSRTAVQLSVLAPQPNVAHEQAISSSDSPRRSQSGVASANVVMSSLIGDNAIQFPEILELHVPPGSKIADVTFGKGVFWSKVDRKKYQIFGSDLQLKEEVRSLFPDLQLKSAVDFASLPYDDDSLDALVLDPPYMEGFYRHQHGAKAGHGTHVSFRQAYSGGQEETTNMAAPFGRLAWQDRVVDAYLRGAHEALRVLRQNGTFIVKCQDAVSANIQRLTHVELITACEQMGFYCKDLFILTRPAKPGISRLIRQAHARKNHSYFLVFTKLRRRPLASSCYHCRRAAEKETADRE